VVRRVARGLGPGEVDQVEQAVLDFLAAAARGEGGVLDADAADGVGARGAVVLLRRFGEPQGGGLVDEREEGVSGGDVDFEGAGELGYPE